MRLLLDTHIVIWHQQRRLDRVGRGLDAVRSAQELLVSVVSFAEMGIKQSVGRLDRPEDIRQHVLDSGARILGLSAEHGLALADLPLHHRDPFDRLLISQARSEGLTILTADTRFERYDVPVVLAGP